MTKIGTFLHNARVISLYRSVGSKHKPTEFVWNWWNPLAWIAAPFLFILSIVLQGAIDTWEYRHDLGFRIHPFYTDNNKEIEWVSPRMMKESEDV
ncbi:hypothetical protein PHIM7_245 [Sinorhizobium phage phiM7]|uniref:Transmembrane protein n=2 Tax=Emdodecavirus TaxID=1980937 RepID=S5MQ52_9CAUD|nr:hypothetical protein AB690_gp262 [Sinorhizobium phage phiM12]YP_009601370.1 hypothetical protein FDH46_gp233 [Sinorhizobium phage phiM7]AGR47960.1 hypothetical protein SmphiM12_328 [Sinorhizobium phage phiM12]AKF12790.1 hypothetical protein PHIM7_245 [Sinorhizobium phage phiM7]AKF13151.1 hypothetical protein PHIM19_246 [Sinorhizobium phage phiM19]